MAVCAVWLVLGLAVGGCSMRSIASREPITPERQITAAIEGWLTALARSAGAPVGAAARPATDDATLAFELVDSSPIPASDLGAWIEALRTDHGQVEYRVAALSIVGAKAGVDETGEAGVFDVRFALERRSVEASGLRHVARWQQRWQVHPTAGAAPVVLSMHEERRLVFPGTGTQIVCF